MFSFIRVHMKGFFFSPELWIPFHLRKRMSSLANYSISRLVGRLPSINCCRWEFVKHCFNDYLQLKIVVDRYNIRTPKKFLRFPYAKLRLMAWFEFIRRRFCFVRDLHHFHICLCNLSHELGSVQPFLIDPDEGLSLRIVGRRASFQS